MVAPWKFGLPLGYGGTIAMVKVSPTLAEPLLRSWLSRALMTVPSYRVMEFCAADATTAETANAATIAAAAKLVRIFISLLFLLTGSFYTKNVLSYGQVMG